MDVKYFDSPDDLRKWLEENHATEKELFVGHYKKASGRQGATYKETVDEMLCFGWIDGITRGIDDVSYCVRYTPRRKDSIWSKVNIKRVGELMEMGRMRPAGIAAFEARTPERMNVYTFEQPDRDFEPEREAQLRANPAAWDFFQRQTPSYKSTVIKWVEGAKQEGTKQRRLALLIHDSEQGRTVKQFTTPAKRK